MENRILRIGFIGNGKGANRYHIPFSQVLTDKFCIKTVYAPQLGGPWPVLEGVEYTTDLEAMLTDPDIDVVEISTPIATHYALTKQALQAGKHVVCDKAFALTAAEGEELFALAEEKGVTVQCYQNRRFDSDYLTARKVADSGKLGRVYEVVTHYDYWRESFFQMAHEDAYDPANGIVYGHSCHCVDQIIAWFGIPDRWRAEARQLGGKGRPDMAFDFDLYYDKLDIKATAAASYLAAIQRPSFEIYGERGTFIRVEKDQQERDLKKFYLPEGHPDFGLDTPEQWGTLRYYDEDGTMHEERVEPVRSTYSAFYEALYETVANGAPQLVKPEETVAQLRILEDSVRNLH